MNSLIIKLLFAGVKKLLSVGGGALVTNGVISSDQNQQVVGAIMTILGVAWEAYQAYQQHKATAAAAPVPSDGLTHADARVKIVEVHQLPPIQ
jgi:uncharacterized membrane protein YebE (DUF533 family)